MLAYSLIYVKKSNSFRARITAVPDGTEVKWVARGAIGSWRWSDNSERAPQEFTGWLGEAHCCVASDAPAIARLWNRSLDREPFDEEEKALRFEVKDFDPTSICACTEVS